MPELAPVMSIVLPSRRLDIAVAIVRDEKTVRKRDNTVRLDADCGEKDWSASFEVVRR